MSTEPGNVRIVMTAHGRGKVFVNGVEVQRVKRVQVSCGTDDANEVILTFVARELEVEGVYNVTSLSDAAVVCEKVE